MPKTERNIRSCRWGMEQAELTVGKQLVWDDNPFFGDGVS